jgi:hypothetical protein
MTLDQDASKLYDASIAVRPGQTRLLRLHQDATVGPLGADLVIVSIGSGGAYLHEKEENVEYTALSYTWGTGPFSHHITINGVPWRIKEGLYDFLHQHRSSHQSLDIAGHAYIWIDALVINQADATEKSHQVANMIGVYTKASHVQIWLGKAAKHTADAVSFLHHLRADIQRKNKTIGDNALDGLRDLYNRSWPTRMWIRQEVWAAKSISIQVGSLNMPLEVFKAGVVFSQEAGDNLDADDGSEASDLGIYSSPRTLKWLHRKLEVADTQLAAISFLTQRLAGQQASEDRAVSGLGYEAMKSDGRKSILWLLYESVNYESTDVRDRIYALIGMCDDPEIEIDYHKTPAEVFTSLARHLIVRAKSLDGVLDQACKYGKQSDLGLPSWVPDWRTLELVRYEGQCIADCDMRGSFNHARPQVLALRGFLLGRAETAKAKKKRERTPTTLVHIDWSRIRDRLKESSLCPDFLSNAPRNQTVALDSANRESMPGDCLVAVCGSNQLLLLRRHTGSRGDEYEFISCICSDAKERLRKSLLEYGVENDALETFAVV